MSAAAVGDEAWRRRQRARLRREWLLQGALLLVLLTLVAGIAQNVAANLEARQIKSGFGFLRDPAGFNIGELLFDYSARDSYLRAFAVGAIDGWSRPELDGFLISGGASLTPEFLALWLGLSLFTSASIAELVRAGALAVPVGQWNAALALGLTRRKAIAGVIFPQALRLAIPPLASQYMNLVKNSSLAVVIGYPDLVSIGNTSINQNGQALEVIVIIMAVYLSLNLVVAVAMGAVNARVTRAPR